MIPGSLLLTVASAVLYALSFPPLSWSFLAWVALVPFFLAAAKVRPGYAAACGVLWGVVATYGVGWWFPGMLSNYLGISAFSGWVGFFAVSIGLAGVYFGAFAAWLSWLAHRQAVSPFLVAAGWGTCEFARAHLFVGNPWALSGYSQVSLMRLIQIADATGPYGVGMLIAAVNACVAGFFSPAFRGRRPVISCLVILAALSSTFAYGEWRLSQTFTTEEPVPVAIVQGAIERSVRWDPKHTRANLERYLTLTKQAADTHPALIFWPEYAVNFYLEEASPLSEAAFRLTRDLKADLILGGPYYSFGETKVRRRNSVFLVHEGRLKSRYDKQRLLPLAEQNHWAWLFPHIADSYEPGDDIPVLRTRAARIGVFVCIEAVYPEFVRRFVLQGAEVLVNPSNDDWFGHAAPARHHLDIASVRAIENRRYLVRATTTGFSGVIDPYGRIVALSGFGSPEVVTASIIPSQAQTPYQCWGDAITWGAIGLVFFASFYRMVWFKPGKMTGREE